jgi:hypothetical protein
MTAVLKFTKVEQDKSHTNVQETRERELTLSREILAIIYSHTPWWDSPCSRTHSKQKEVFSFLKIYPRIKRGSITILPQLQTENGSVKHYRSSSQVYSTDICLIVLEGQKKTFDTHRYWWRKRYCIHMAKIEW